MLLEVVHHTRYDYAAAVSLAHHLAHLQPLDDAHQHTVSPGVFLNLPDAPYRAKFADDRGVYYQASRALRFSTQDGAVIEVDGGLYMLHDNPLQATTWFYPTLGAPATPHKAAVKVNFFSAQY